MALTQDGCVNAHPFAWRIDDDAERGNGGARGAQSSSISRRCDEHLGETHDADHAGDMVATPSEEEPARIRMMMVAGVECADQNIGVERHAHRLASSWSSCSR